jgi:methionyl aminopeptidase
MTLIKSTTQVAKIKKSARILSGVMKELRLLIKPGVSLLSLNDEAEKMILEKGASPSFKNYRGFPASLCVSVNEMVVHGVPTERRLKSGDIVSLDLGVFYQGFHADMAITVPVQSVDQESQKLIYVTEEALMRGVEAARAGNHLGDIGYAISHYVWGEGFDVVRELCGHGIGRSIHEDPDVLNFGKKGEGLMLRPGMVLCLEPMVTVGRGRVKLADDGLGFLTDDGSRSAHFEHTIAITNFGPEILT